MPALDPTQLLSEFDDVLRTMPPRATIRHDTDENFAWLGRASALVTEWNLARGLAFDGHVRLLTGHAQDANNALRGIVLTLQHARHALRTNIVGPLSLGIDKGKVFDYFDEVRKIIESAKGDLLFVDPFLDAEFVSRYLDFVPQGVVVRLLARKHLATLLPSVSLFRQQSGLSIEVRSSPTHHDRFVFVDGAECYLSGASFKDGARLSPTTLTQITDAFQPMRSIYEALWQNGTVQAL